VTSSEITGEQVIETIPLGVPEGKDFFRLEAE